MGIDSCAAAIVSGGGEALNLGHRHELESLLAGRGEGLSEYCFANLYLFRNVHDYKLVSGNLPCISGKTYDNCRYLMPLFDLSAVEHESLLKLASGYDFFFPVSESIVENLDRQRFSVENNSDDSDYVYAVEALRTYRGKKLAKKKNLMKQFATNSDPCLEAFSKQRADDAVDILAQWQADKGKKEHETDYGPCLEAIRLFEELGLVGLICYAGTDPAGFLLAREVSPGVMAIHFAKGKNRYVGVFQYMFNQFANRVRGQADFINFEQDLGNPGFRKTKRSYCPDRLFPKFRVLPLA